jgi:hypothetical protein
MKKIIIMFIFCFIANISIKAAIIPVSWQVTTNTGNSANIGIQAGSVVMVGNRPIQNGDAIGAFFERNGQRVCAGYLIWNGTQFGWTVWGDNYNTPLKDGYAVQEDYFFKMWDGQTGKEYPAIPHYATPANTHKYYIMGLTVIDSIGSYVPVSTQSILVSQGPNLISSYIIPSNPSLASIFGANSDKIIFARDKDFQYYSIAYDIYETEEWNTLSPYYIYAFSPFTLTLSGDMIQPETTPIALNAGWNYIPYLRESSMAADVALASILPYVLKMVDLSGQQYTPTVNTLEFGTPDAGKMIPGKGYIIFVTQPCTLIYPAN